RAAAMPIHTFSVGQANTTPKQDDVAITSISTSPQPFVAMKARLSVRVTIDAHGRYEGKSGTVRLVIENKETGKDDPVTVYPVSGTGPKEDKRDAKLERTTGNVVDLVCDAPDKQGEYKVKVTVETDPPDKIPANNVMETFVTVGKVGVTVLLVDRSRAEG